MNKKQLKFRVWDGNKMEYSVACGIYGTFYVNPEKGDGLDPEDSACLTPCNTKYPDDISIMQNTGLKDKNGAEIYEGDILQTGNGKFEVKFSEGSFNVFKISEKDAEDFLYNYSDEFGEIIGNIFEN